MPGTVKLTVIKGPLTGEVFDFNERTSCVIGRGLDCYPRLPDDEYHRTISRTHCLIDINPPDIRIRDFGSLNGTYVNGAKIGQRRMGQQVGSTALTQFPENDLKDGDEIRLGGTQFKVTIIAPEVCSYCGESLTGQEGELSQGKDSVCHRCSAAKTGERKPRRPQFARKIVTCSKCGKDVTKEINPDRPGEYVCTACRDNPMDIVKAMVDEANEGESTLIAIKGYQITRELGQGGMGAVYLAKHMASDEMVALKVMLPEVASDENSRNMFLREVETTKALSHTNIVSLKDSGYSDGIFFFTLEFCDSGSVDMLMEERGGKLSIEEAMPIVLQALDGLEYAHNVDISVTLADGSTANSRGIVHRDIKPANIFLTSSNEGTVAKLADVGLGKAFDMAGLSGQTRTGAVVGTPFFMPRQQVINFKYAKPDVDVWGIAASLYNMLTGRLPRPFKKSQDPWQTVLTTSARPIRDLESSIPEKLANVIDEALIDNPDIIHKSAKDLKAALLGAI